METQQMCRKILLSLNQLRLNEELCDVQLLVENVPLPAHCLVLAGTSPFFKRLVFEQQSMPHQMFKLDGISKIDMLRVLDFLYTGQLILTHSNIKTYKQIAEQLNIPVLIEHCKSFCDKCQLKPEPQSTDGHKVAAKTKKKTVKPRPPSTYTRQSEFLLEAYKSQTRNFHSYCIQKDLLNISSETIAFPSSATANSRGTHVSPVEDLSVCCQLQTQSEELNSGEGMYGMYRGCTDTCCGEVLSSESIKQEIKQEQDCEAWNPENFEVACGAMDMKLKSVEDIAKTDVQLQYVLAQIKQEECDDDQGSWTHGNTDGKKHKKTTGSCDPKITGSCDPKTTDSCDPRTTISCDTKITGCCDRETTGSCDPKTVDSCNIEITNACDRTTSCSGDLRPTVSYDLKTVDKHITKPAILGKNTFVGCCEYCPFKTVVMKSLARHRQEHHRNGTAIKSKNSKKALHCCLCNYSCAIYVNMKLHQYKVHNKLVEPGLKISNCLKCSFSTVYSPDLSIHVARVHGKRKFKCTRCSLQLTTRLGLRAHMYTHSIKHLKCGKCNYKGRRKPHVDRHMEGKHLAINQAFSCACCGHTSKSQVTNHRVEGCKKKGERENRPASNT